MSLAEIMAKLITDGQQARTAVLYPGARYSRVVTCQDVAVQAVPGFGVSLPVGQRVWLLSIRLWHRHAGPDTNDFTIVRFFTGTTRISSAADILGWEEIMPVVGGADVPVYWRLYDEWPSMEWSMTQFFVGEGRRFGIYTLRSAGALSDEIYVSFEVAEG